MFGIVHWYVDNYQLTFNTRITNFKKHLESFQTRHRLLKIWVWYRNRALPSAGTFPTYNVQHVSETSEVLRILNQICLLNADTFSNMTSSVYRLFRKNDFIFPTLRSESFHRAVFFQVTCIQFICAVTVSLLSMTNYITLIQSNNVAKT